MSSIAASLCSLLAVGLLAGCASTGRDARSGEAPAAVRYTVKQGDRLGDIAREVTGELDNWEAIAAHNGIADPRTLAIGTVIEIPAALIPPDPADIVVASDAAALPASDSPVVSRPVVGEANEPGMPVVVTAVTSNRRFELAPLDEDAAERFTADRYVKVIGTYYPIAIYAEPAGAARLLLRVAPGTLLPLDREIGDWLRVTTDDGPGYLRSNDGKILSARDRSASLAE